MQAEVPIRAGRDIGGKESGYGRALETRDGRLCSLGQAFKEVIDLDSEVAVQRGEVRNVSRSTRGT